MTKHIGLLSDTYCYIIILYAIFHQYPLIYLTSTVIATSFLYRFIYIIYSNLRQIHNCLTFTILLIVHSSMYIQLYYVYILSNDVLKLQNTTSTKTFHKEVLEFPLSK